MLSTPLTDRSVPSKRQAQREHSVHNTTSGFLTLQNNQTLLSCRLWHCNFPFLIFKHWTPVWYIPHQSFYYLGGFQCSQPETARIFFWRVGHGVQSRNICCVQPLISVNWPFHTYTHQNRGRDYTWFYPNICQSPLPKYFYRSSSSWFFGPLSYYIHFNFKYNPAPSVRHSRAKVQPIEMASARS